MKASRWAIAALVAVLSLVIGRRLWHEPNADRRTEAAADRSGIVSREGAEGGTREATGPAGEDVPAIPAAAERPVKLERQLADRLLAFIAAKTDPVEREQAAQEGALKVPRALLGGVLTLLQREHGRPFAAEAVRALLLRWAWEEPTGAAVWTLQSAAGETRREALGAVAAGWTRQSPETLLHWSGTLDAVERDWVVLHGAACLARTDLAMFSAWQSLLPPSRERDQLLAATARDWAGRDPLALAVSLHEADGAAHAAWRLAAAHALAGQLVAGSDLSGAQAVIAAMPAGPEQRTVLAGVVAQASRTEPTAVAAWLAGVEDRETRAELSALLAGNWVVQNPAAAADWARTLPRGLIADTVAERLAQHTAASEIRAE